MLKLFRIFFILNLFFLTGCEEKKPLISVFPLKNYDQNIDRWISPISPDYDKLIMNAETQHKNIDIFYKHYFGNASPWSESYVKKIIEESQPNDIKTTEDGLIKFYNNKYNSEEERGYGENFRLHNDAWINEISNNIHTAQFNQLRYDSHNRAIAVDNLSARSLPTNDVSFYRHTLPGQGYPFDNLQMSSIWVGTPLYILGETQDHAWSFVISPDVIAWVKTSNIARVDAKFIKKWSDTAIKNMIAIARTKTSILEKDGTYRFTTYIGTLFPGFENPHEYKILIPIANEKRQALIHYATVTKENAVSIPLAPTRRHFVRIMKSLLGRPYGWGNLYFYNDCSAELKNLFTVFGIWLPRHSSDQVYAGKMVDLSSESLSNRIHFLQEHGHPFSTLIYVDGHILLYIGNYPNPNSPKHELIPMTYQNMWGLRPHPSTRRAIIGKSVIFPLLAQYPEDPSLASQASKKTFQVSELNEVSNHLIKLEIIDLKELMYP